MKKYLRILNTLVEQGVINLKDYYVINIWGKELIIQGHYKDELANNLIDKGFIISIDDDFTYLINDNIKIVLTH